MITALFSLSASACFAIVLSILSGSLTSLSSTDDTSSPQEADTVSTSVLGVKSITPSTITEC